MTDPGVQSPESTPKPLTNSVPAGKGRTSLGKTPTGPKKLASWGISGNQTDPLYLLSQLRKHVVFRNGNRLVTTITPLEEAFNAITEILHQSLIDQSAEMTRLTGTEQTAKSHANDAAADLESLRESLTTEIHASTNYIANLIQLSSPSEETPSQTQRPSVSYVNALKGNTRGNHGTATARAPIADEARKHQITVKTSRIDANHPILKADPAQIVEIFNKAIRDTLEAKDSNLLTPIAARSARRLKSGDLTLQLRSSDECELLCSNAKEWLPRLAPGAWTHIPKFNVVVNGVPADFDPSSEHAIRTLEEDNPDILLPYSVDRARWLRTPKSSAGSIVLEIKDSRSANQAIDSGLSLNFSLFTAHKLTPRITQCFNCQEYGHIAKTCKKTVSCGLCTGAHGTRTCPSALNHNETCSGDCGHSNRQCSNCNGPHTSFDRTCSVRIAERERIENLPENTDPHFSPYMGSTSWSAPTIITAAPKAARS